MKFSIHTLNDNGSGMEYHSMEDFFNELKRMIKDCVDNGGTYFDININADASCFCKDDD